MSSVDWSGRTEALGLRAPERCLAFLWSRTPSRGETGIPVPPPGGYLPSAVGRLLAVVDLDDDHRTCAPALSWSGICFHAWSGWANIADWCWMISV